MKEGLKHRTKRIGLLLVPVVLAVGIWMYISTPQYALRRYMDAVRKDDVVAARRLVTPRYAKFHEGRFFYRDWEWEKAHEGTRDSGVWQRPDATHAHVTYTSRQLNRTWRYHLVKTKEGWKIDDTSLL